MGACEQRTWADHAPLGTARVLGCLERPRERLPCLRKETLAPLTVWEAQLGQEAAPPAGLAGPPANTFEDRKGRGEVSVEAAVESGGGEVAWSGVFAIVSVGADLPAPPLHPLAGRAPSPR